MGRSSSKTQTFWNHGHQDARSEKQLSKLNLICKLCRTLKEENILYCHWKSNDALDRSASGDNDLDLLVSRADAERFDEILSRLGFKQAEAPPEHRMLGVLDYYGYDSDADKLVHVHAHYQLIVGHDMTKNYSLPIERPYLESAVQGDLFMVPTPEFEFIVFVIRMVLKHSTWDTILIKHGRLSSSERQELPYLQTRIDRERIDNLLMQHLPCVDAGLFSRCLRTLQPDCPMWVRIKVGQQLQNALKAYTRRNRLQDIRLKLWRRVKWGFRRRVLGKHLSARRLLSGGAIVAIIGGDGAGKTSAVDGTYEWLAKDLEVTKVHLGKPSWSRTTQFVRGLLKVGRLLTSTPFATEASFVYEPDAKPSGFTTYSLLLRSVCVGRDRYLAYVKARRLATNGSLVICDRFPLSQVKMMDAPQIEYILHGKPTNRFQRYLVRLEKHYFQLILPPELLIVLRIDSEIAVKRRIDEPSRPVRVRNQEIWAASWDSSDAYVVDASRPQDKVLSKLKTIIWSKL